MSYRIHSLKKNCRQAFTLVEVLVSMTVLVILLLISAQVINTVQSTWTTSNARVSQFREARIAFDIITRNLSQATLNSYIDYDKSYLITGVAGANNTAPPKYYQRKSDLRFVTGMAADLLAQGNGMDISPGHAVFFQAPLGVAHDPAYVGLDRLLCGRGYFVQYTSDAFFRPGILPSGLPSYRYRLMEFSPPAEKNLIYENVTLVPQDVNQSKAWYAQAGVPQDEDEIPTNRGLTRPIADNIVALIIAPQVENNVANVNDPNAFNTSFAYDSITDTEPTSDTKQGTQHRLPALVKVVLVAIDEKSADRLSQMSDPATPPFGGLLSQKVEPPAGGGIVNLNDALKNVASELKTLKVNYRIFSATVSLRGAKVGG